MARLWSCGFELQSATAGVEWDTTGAGTPAISTTTVRTGAAALRINPSAALMNIEHQLDASGTVKRTFHRFYLRIATAPSATTAIYAIGQSGFFPCYLRLSNARTLQLFDGNTAAAVGSSSAALALNTWYRVEIDHNDGASGTATVTAYLDGVSFGTGAVSVINGFSRVRMGVYSVAATADLFFDDWAINDTAGSDQTGLPGAGSIIHLNPNGAGDNNTWKNTAGGAGSSTNWQEVDEVTPDDATTIIQRNSSAQQIDDYAAADATGSIGASDTITLVAVGVRGGAATATAGTGTDVQVRMKTQASGTVVTSASSTNRMNVNGTWVTHSAVVPRIYQLVRYTDPQGNIAWTLTRLNAMQIGVMNQTVAATVVKVTKVWALVEFVPATTLFVAVGLATETDTAFAITRRKVRAVGLAAQETDTAFAIARSKVRAIGLTTETDTATIVARRKLRAVGLASETDSATVVGRRKVRAIALATETDTAFTVAHRKLVTVGLATETDTATVVNRLKRRGVGLATETDTAFAIGHYKRVLLGIASEVDTAMVIARVKLRALGLATETDSALQLTSFKVKQIGIATEHDFALGLLSLNIQFKDISLTVGPTRLRERVSIGATRISWDIDVTRLSWAIVETTVRRVVELDITRSRAQATIAATRGSTEVGATRLGVDIAQTRIERGER